ncbi:hypothetical protein AVU38_gp104 [Ralstonia phage RSL2]|uniref:Uncharacterized protein n=1 Tax=Ralstonia phage RSL2 TaxID=1585840 RepID=A0A0A8J8U0_9CAUD|nr:hypothetical protein AVU38_gp104 [Ralstonia phage RSL2]BAQ02632.1 hypothetical protein [Ralstonia phage RSL2]
MIKDAKFAQKQINNQQRCEAVLRFVARKDPVDGTEHQDQPVPKLEFKQPAVFPKNAPTGITHGLYFPGKIPANKFEIDQLQREWAVIKTTANMSENILDEWPPMETPIVVQIAGRRTYTEGMMVRHEMVNDGVITNEYVFMELLREGNFEFSANAPVKFGIDGAIEDKKFVPVDFKNVYAWAYLTDDGQMFRIPDRWLQPVELFVDCEFDDSTKTLLSVGITNKFGRTYYAFDSAAADKVESEWLKEHVIPVLLDVPQGTLATDLVRNKITFSDWLTQVLSIEQGNEAGLMTQDVVIHVDFPTDVAYVAELLHLGEGKRIGQMRNFTFKIDYVDAYPTQLKGAVQHNAAWDAMAIWFHLGYVSYRVMDEIGKQAMQAQAAKEDVKPEKQKIPPLVEGLIQGALQHAPKK